jgi:hypothetical protein
VGWVGTGVGRYWGGSVLGWVGTGVGTGSGSGVGGYWVR